MWNSLGMGIKNQFQIVRSFGIVCLRGYWFRLSLLKYFSDHFALKKNSCVITSQAWLHFSKKDDTGASCSICKMIISTKGRDSTNMLKHLSIQHGLNVQECHVFDSLRTSDIASQLSGTSISDNLWYNNI